MMVAQVQFEQVGSSTSTAGPWSAAPDGRKYKLDLDATNTTLTTKLNKAAGDIITGPINLQVSNALYAGTPTDGVYIGSGGLVGKKAGATTFALTAAGDLALRGDLSSGTAARSGTTMTGSGADIRAAGDASIGGSNGNITVSGGLIYVNGSIILDGNLSLSSITATITAGDLSASLANTTTSVLVGQRSVSVSGGVGPFTYSWVDSKSPEGSGTLQFSPAGSLLNIYGSGTNILAAYSVTCTVTDANGRSAKVSFLVSATFGTVSSGVVSGVSLYSFAFELSPDNAYTGVRLLSDGTCQVKNTSGVYVAAGNWYTPTQPGIGSSYWVRATLDSGSDAFTSGPVAVWTNLGSGAIWTKDIITDGFSSQMCNAGYVLALSSGGATVATGHLTCEASVEL
jgi:hypothetical protein